DFKQSTGDEAGGAPKKNVITSKIKGKCYYTAWSMDVKIEGENAVRHLDLMTHNHASDPGATPPWPFMDARARGGEDPCEKDKDKEQKACEGYTPNGPVDPCPAPPGGEKPATDAPAMAYARQVEANACLRARRCKLQPYKDTEKGKGGCCDGQTG